MYEINRNRRNTELASLQKSMFKFVLRYHTKVKTVGCPNVLYSQDTADERALFLPGISQDQRIMWQNFQNNLSDNAFQFFAWAYPYFKNTTDVSICYTATPAINERLQALSADEKQEIGQVAATAGFNIAGIRPISQHVAEPKPTVTPKFHPNLAKFNGMNAVKRWIYNTYAAKGLIEVVVYDNLCYNMENYIETWVLEQNLRQAIPAQQPPRYKEPVAVGALLPKFDSSENLQNNWK